MDRQAVIHGDSLRTAPADTTKPAEPAQARVLALLPTTSHALALVRWADRLAHVAEGVLYCGRAGSQGCAPDPQRDLHRGHQPDPQLRGTATSPPRHSSLSTRSAPSVPSPSRWMPCSTLVVTGSQKAWMSAPGMAFAAVAERAWAAMETARMPRFYFDLRRARESAASGQTPWTPAVAVLYQATKACADGRRSTPAAIFARHASCAAATGAGLLALGSLLLADPSHASQTVTAAWVPEGSRLEGLQRRAQAAGPRRRRRPMEAQVDLPDRPSRVRGGRGDPRGDRRDGGGRTAPRSRRRARRRGRGSSAGRSRGPRGDQRSSGRCGRGPGMKILVAEALAASAPPPSSRGR